MNEQAADSTRAFLGVGWAFPPRLENDGQIATAVYEEDIRQAIRIILGTNPGERVMRPEFGAGLNTFLFEPVNSTTRARIKMRVQEALVAWEPRIEVEEVRVTVASEERNTLFIELGYRVMATNSRFNLVYPFYLQEGTAL